MLLGLKIVLLFFATVIAFWLSAISGGGASLILIPILNWLLPVTHVPFALTIGTFSSSASRVVIFRKHVNWKIFSWFVPFSIPAVLLGAWLIKYINPLYLQIVVSLFLISNLPELFRSRKQTTSEEKPYPKFILSIVGFIAGFVSGITGAIGLLFNRFYLRYGLSKEQIVATRAANEIFLHGIKLVIYIALGLSSTNALLFGLAIAIGSIISSVSVKHILPLISELLFRKIGYGAMVISGFILMGETGQKIIKQDSVVLSTHLINQGAETTVNWRNSNLVLEFNFDDGLEIERPLLPDDLPTEFKIKYSELIKEFDHIMIEKVFRFREPEAIEFYCYKNGKLTKLEFAIHEFEDNAR
ncbi:MAG: sulfite exporter TauE/SafE family protein [Cyclobacteriaceae bacterium]|nr:sulfite exporter TauE/SafE family protein [Cyclobacteriaceae bacterium]